jgi:hypothetical protein
MKEIANVEGVSLYSHGENTASRDWVLDTYADCLKTVRGFRRIQS